MFWILFYSILVRECICEYWNYESKNICKFKSNRSSSFMILV